MARVLVFVLGGPGAGKGTQCARLVRDYGFVHLSAGELLREERRRPGSDFAELIEGCIREGRIVPVEVTCALLEAAMAGGAPRYLIDGFPRNRDNLLGWEAALGERSRPRLVLQLECGRDECARRCLARGAAGSGRSDDNERSLRLRFDTYANDTLPIVRHYEELGLLARVNADRDPDEVYRAVEAALQKIGIGPLTSESKNASE